MYIEKASTLFLSKILRRQLSQFTCYLLISSTKIENTTFLCKTALSEANVRTNRMGVQNGLFTKKGDLPVTTLFLWKFCAGLRTSYKELIWCISNPKPRFILFAITGVLFEDGFSLWVSLIKIYFPWNRRSDFRNNRG